MSKMDKKMYLPNYKDGSIVNLMSSIGRVLGWKSRYKPLKGLDLKLLKRRNVILIVIDGLGYEFLERYGKGSFLEKNLKQKITSVFPATTASAVTTLLTGVAPQQHGLTGWFMNLNEIKKVAAVIPMIVRGEDKPKKINKNQTNGIYDYQSFFERIKVNSYAITHKDFITSQYTKSINKKAKVSSCQDSDGFIEAIKKVVRSGNHKKFINAYWAEFDYHSHTKGPFDDFSIKHFHELDRKIESLAEYLKDTDSVLIVTADHGLIERKEEEKVIILNDYPKIYETLECPISGDTRTVYCYVKNSMKKQFEAYVKKDLKNVCIMRKSQDLIKENYFGLFGKNKKLSQRVGNYTLLAKDSYIIKDRVPNEKMNVYIGNHGGLSKEEMFVPLIIVSL